MKSKFRKPVAELIRCASEAPYAFGKRWFSQRLIGGIGSKRHGIVVERHHDLGVFYQRAKG